ncbi:sensor histidine kinase [Aminobacter anthyllidis]|uniref:histidine kinase n=1 Tax=Aminobacter anthyllidis TaxID=1035067 RepID=A0A9X1ACS8_9HYPH|nr:sensor histidine kinase [Aminobacter anthyllidis]MBT1157506.1 sensor histidine kinase [Aminobacter anthyllidis]
MANSPTAGQSKRVDVALLHASRNAGIAVLYQDHTLHTVWSHNLQPPWAGALEEQTGEGGFLPEQQADRLVAAKKNVLATGNSDGLEVSIADNSAGMRWFDVCIDADRSPGGQVQGVVVTVIETTEQKRREQTLKALLREVSHRSKNLLAIIQSIASQTGHYSGSIDIFLERFRGRLQSLASSQDLVTSSNWRGAGFRELVVGQVKRYSNDTEHAVRILGEDPYLNPNAALHIGLAVHELAVNSVSYGALSRVDGHVEVTASKIKGPDGEEQIALHWSEIIDPVADASMRKKRFGSVALERVVPAALNGNAELEIGVDKLQYRLVMPQANFELEQD